MSNQDPKSSFSESAFWPEGTLLTAVFTSDSLTSDSLIVIGLS